MDITITDIELNGWNCGIPKEHGEYLVITPFGVKVRRFGYPAEKGIKKTDAWILKESDIIKYNWHYPTEKFIKYYRSIPPLPEEIRRMTNKIF